MSHERDLALSQLQQFEVLRTEHLQHAEAELVEVKARPESEKWLIEWKSDVVQRIAASIMALRSQQDELASLED